MIKVVALSDSHVSSLNSLPSKILDELASADWVVHAGDFTEANLVNELKTYGNFKGVRGNMDSPEVKALLPETELLEVRGFVIGICHPAEGGPPLRIEERVRRKFDKVDVIIYGHTHKPKNEVRDNVLYLNPGSSTGAWPAAYASYGILEIEDTIKARIVRI
ncbi:MAG: metallophosphoesterase [Thaumarchaeota archaeon]|jgi:putative phosphoesterase|nr:metallophosphoesterase [Candidatus Terraquivivens yellowstonensis]MCL7392649.1 metallophosphoesterase [Candidatus Terraquivivens yellowstonensis]MCL7395684.1 metallophosphoesterase [Candidatus Terraquivivens yellowstonensis]MCL7398604.1 metallophosphoesterase [Candidatus Terraquivivens yellowstonensis]MCL7399641.1 metallophosphoesterase [Candidatus Terraquivivens yellowstonensis]